MIIRQISITNLIRNWKYLGLFFAVSIIIPTFVLYKIKYVFPK